MIVLTNIVCYYKLSAKPNRQLYVLCVALKYLESSYFRRLMTYQRQDGSNDKKKIGQKMIIFIHSSYFQGEVRKSFRGTIRPTIGDKVFGQFTVFHVSLIRHK